MLFQAEMSVLVPSAWQADTDKVCQSLSTDMESKHYETCMGAIASSII